MSRMVPAVNIIVVAESDVPAHVERAAALAERLSLPLRRAADFAAGELALAFHHDALELRDHQARPGRGLSVDFSALNPQRASKRGEFSRNQPLARAIGKSARTVLDATAGLGHDAALLACMGHAVTAVERSPIVAALLEDGVRRALNDSQLQSFFAQRLAVLNADAREVLRARGREFDAVYIDPMFPPKRKASALAKKSIRLVRRLVGDDEDAGELLAIATQSGAARIAVKRPHHAPPLAPNPIAVIMSKLVRYDVYAQA